MPRTTYWPRISQALYQLLVVLNRYGATCIKRVALGAQFAADLLALLTAVQRFITTYGRYFEPA